MAVKPKTEKQLEDVVKKKIATVLLCYVIPSAVSMFSNGGRGRSGIADFYVSWYGRALWIEAKATSKHEPRLDQCDWLDGKRDAGDMCIVVNGDNVKYLANYLRLIGGKHNKKHIPLEQTEFNGGFLSLQKLFTDPWESRLKDL